MSQNKNQNTVKNKKINVIQLFLSVLAAFFGVQSNKARARDFTIGNPVHYITVGLIVVLVFIFILYEFVQLVMYCLVK